ncbi:hypothetical protein ES707_06254 [subsurface metagenome]
MKITTDAKLTIQDITEERRQGHGTRRHLYAELEKELGIPIVAYFTSFRYAVTISDDDVDLLEQVLQKCDLKKGFAILISSPGGSGLTAERIVNVCRSYSGTGEYATIIPSKAKSAATIICLGSCKMFMSKTSELGSIDPQLVIEEDKKVKWFSVYNLVKSYRDLFDKAVKEKGNLQPYIQQLANYDEREITEYEAALALSDDMAVKILKTGMLAHRTPSQIKKQIHRFLTPEEVKVHGRPINAQEAIDCGLNVEMVNLRSKRWSLIRQLYVRLNNFVSSDNIPKCIECEQYSFRATIRGS